MVGTSFTAYLTDKQVEQLAKDKRVKLLTEDAYLEPSALWNSTTDYTGQARSWGLYALGVSSAGSSNGGATVYVLDTGVEMHGDLPGLSAADRISALAGINPNGCYPHATHVAGIIGAADNGYGVVGVLPGVRLVSIALGDTNLGWCSQGYPISAFAQGLDKIYQRVLQSHRVAIVNISFNSSGYFSSTGTIGLKMKVVATASYLDGGYPGAFIVQSAGNQLSDACGYAFNAPAAYDGIMVVGGLDDNGQPVRMLNTLPGYSNAPFGGDGNGSNTGGCVEAWAPSQRINSTWSGGYALLSGTSMAAPHVAGFAARLLESDPYIVTSLDLEAAVRAHFTTISGSNLWMPRLVNVNETARPTIEIAEGSIRSSLSPPTSFSKIQDEVNLQFQAVGAADCYVDIINNGAYYLYHYYLPTTYSFGTYFLPHGQNTWTVTCTSPQGTQTTTVAYGFVKRGISLNWYASTTSTFGSQAIPHGGTVSWSISANAPFDQYFASSGADYCHVQSFGWVGDPSWDPEYPSGYRSPFTTYYSQQPYPPPEPFPLWDSGGYFPTYYTFATFRFGDPNSQPNALGLQPYHGYKWRLMCWNYDGISKTTIMYGMAQP